MLAYLIVSEVQSKFLVFRYYISVENKKCLRNFHPPNRTKITQRNLSPKLYYLATYTYCWSNTQPYTFYWRFDLPE